MSSDFLQFLKSAGQTMELLLEENLEEEALAVEKQDANTSNSEEVRKQIEIGAVSEGEAISLRQEGPLFRNRRVMGEPWHVNGTGVDVTLNFLSFSPCFLLPSFGFGR